MKKLLICALCVLAACQSERSKVSKECINDTKGKYNVIFGHFPSVYACRERLSGKWHIFEADSALEMMYQNQLKNTKQIMNNINQDYTKYNVIHKVLYNKQGDTPYVIGYLPVDNILTGSHNTVMGEQILTYFNK